MTKLKFTVQQENTTPTFGKLNIGDAFTSIDGIVPFVKTAVMYDEHQDCYNTISFDGEFYWSDDEEEIEPIQDIEIIIKK